MRDSLPQQDLLLVKKNKKQSPVAGSPTGPNIENIFCTWFQPLWTYNWTWCWHSVHSICLTCCSKLVAIEQPGGLLKSRPTISLQDLRGEHESQSSHTRRPAKSSCVSYLLDEFAAQRDVGAAEDVGHVSGHTEVVLFIRLWHLHVKRQSEFHRAAFPAVWIKTSHPGGHQPGWASCWLLWNGSSLPERKRRRSAFLGWGASITRDGWLGHTSSGDIIIYGGRRAKSCSSSLTCGLVVDQFAHFALHGGESFPRLLLYQKPQLPQVGKCKQMFHAVTLERGDGIKSATTECCCVLLNNEKHRSPTAFHSFRHQVAVKGFLGLWSLTNYNQLGKQLSWTLFYQKECMKISGTYWKVNNNLVFHEHHLQGLNKSVWENYKTFSVNTPTEGCFKRLLMPLVITLLQLQHTKLSNFTTKLCFRNLTLFQRKK